jgi:tetratricopeptide (TPR) repeat protein
MYVDVIAGIKELRHAIALAPEVADAWYDLGCALSLSGQREEALACLHAAISRDEKLANIAAEDPDFDTIRSDDRFMAILRGENKRTNVKAEPIGG